MSEPENRQEVEVEVIEQVEPAEDAERSKEARQGGKRAGESVGQAINSFMDTLEAALTGRGNSVMVRVNDEALHKLDMLVSAGICKSRSESAAFLLQRGIESSETVFSRISEVTEQITELRQGLLDWVQQKDQ
jgi:hypothetical protein